MVSFISIAFLVVTLKIFKVFRVGSAFMEWSLLGGLRMSLFYYAKPTRLDCVNSNIYSCIL